MTTFGNEEELTVLPHFITLRGSTRAPEHGCPWGAACAPGSLNSTAVPVNPRDSPRTCGEWSVPWYILVPQAGRKGEHPLKAHRVC